MSSEAWLALVIAILALLALAAAAVVQTIVGRTSKSRVQSALGQTPDTTGRQRVRGSTDPRQGLVATMILVQVLAAIFSASLLTYVLDVATDANVDWLAIAITVIFYLIFGQIIPRAIGEKELDPYIDRIISGGYKAGQLFSPVVWIIDRGVRQTKSLLPGSAIRDDDDDIDEVRSSARSNDMDEVREVEREMIDGILGLETMNVREIMVPRLDIIAVDRAVSSDELIETITNAGHSRIPVYQESVDRILGVLYAKDLLPFVIGTTRRIPLLDLIRPAFVVPESKKVNDLFAELKRTKIHIAIVADEYGGTAGLVTIEDILEEIVGEIQDEYDSEQPLFEQDDRHVLLADGRLPIEDVEDALQLEFEEDDSFGTLGGFVHKHLGRLPIQGDAFEAEGVRVEILSVERHRVRRLRITNMAASVSDQTDDSDGETDRASVIAGRNDSNVDDTDQ